MTTTREQMSRDARATLIHEWDQGKERYRLLAAGKWSAGFEDEYVIEQLGADGLGEPRWSEIMRWKPDDAARTSTLLVGAVKSLLSRTR